MKTVTKNPYKTPRKISTKFLTKIPMKILMKTCMKILMKTCMKFHLTIHLKTPKILMKIITKSILISNILPKPVHSKTRVDNRKSITIYDLPRISIASLNPKFLIKTGSFKNHYQFQIDLHILSSFP